MGAPYTLGAAGHPSQAQTPSALRTTVVLGGALSAVMMASGCAAPECDSGFVFNTDGLCVPAPPAQPSGGGDTADTGLDTGDTARDTADTADTADSGDTADTADTGDTAPPPDPIVPFDTTAWLPISAVWYGLSVAPDGTVWAAAAGGLLHLDPITGAGRLYGIADGLYSDTPRAVLAASDGTIWVGEVGTVDVQGEHFAVEADGTLTLLAYINYDESAEELANYRIKEQPYGVGAGDIWMGMNEGLCLWDAHKAVYAEHAHPTHPHGLTRGIAFTDEGDIWGGDDDQLARWRYSNDGDLNPAADLFEYWVPWPVEIGTAVNILDLDAAGGRVWLASTSYGLARVDVSDTKGASTTALYAEPTTANAVRTLGDWTVYVGTDAGLYVVDVATDTVASVATVDPDLAEPIQQLATDATHAPWSMWLAEPGKLVRVDKVP